jgi:hypothetical protein
MRIPRSRKAPGIAYNIVPPSKSRPCAYCRNWRYDEPMVERTAYYASGRITVEKLCPYCVQDQLAAELIQRHYPAVYEIVRDGRYYHLRLVPQLRLFTEETENGNR